MWSGSKVIDACVRQGICFVAARVSGGAGVKRTEDAVMKHVHKANNSKDASCIIVIQGLMLSTDIEETRKARSNERQRSNKLQVCSKRPSQMYIAIVTGRPARSASTKKCLPKYQRDRSMVDANNGS